MDKLDSEQYRFTGPHRVPLEALLAQAVGDVGRLPAALERAVCDFVREARARAVPPERVVVALKTMTSNAARGRTSDDRYHALVEQVIALCVEEYYRPH